MLTIAPNWYEDAQGGEWKCVLVMDSEYGAYCIKDNVVDYFKLDGSASVGNAPPLVRKIAQPLRGFINIYRGIQSQALASAYYPDKENARVHILKHWGGARYVGTIDLSKAALEIIDVEERDAENTY